MTADRWRLDVEKVESFDKHFGIIIAEREIVGGV